MTPIHSKAPMNFEQLVTLCLEAHEAIHDLSARAVDTKLAVRNWFFGWYIVEYEHNGEDRAQYGASVIKRLSGALKRHLGKGLTPRSLVLARRFYLAFQIIPQTLSTERAKKGVHFLPGLTEWKCVLPTISCRFPLGWAHYVELLTIVSPEERRFYEIKAAVNLWGVCELRSQIASSLYERPTLSRDKDEIHRIVTDGQILDKTPDVINNPLVPEFLGLAELPFSLYEKNDLESLLLVLGNGFLCEECQRNYTFSYKHCSSPPIHWSNLLLQCYFLFDFNDRKITIRISVISRCK